MGRAPTHRRCSPEHGSDLCDFDGLQQQRCKFLFLSPVTWMLIHLLQPPWCSLALG